MKIRIIEVPLYMFTLKIRKGQPQYVPVETGPSEYKNFSVRSGFLCNFNMDFKTTKMNGTNYHSKKKTIPSMYILYVTCFTKSITKNRLLFTYITYRP